MSADSVHSRSETKNSRESWENSRPGSWDLEPENRGIGMFYIAMVQGAGERVEPGSGGVSGQVARRNHGKAHAAKRVGVSQRRGDVGGDWAGPPRPGGQAWEWRATILGFSSAGLSARSD